MFSVLVVVLEIGPKYSAQMAFAKDYDVVGAFTANTSVKPFDVGILPGTVVSGDYFLYPHRLNALAKRFAVDAVAVSKKILGCGVPREGLDNLLSCPSSRRVCSDVEVNDPATDMAQDDKHVQHSKSNRRHDKKVHGDHLSHVIFDEGSPSLRGRFSRASTN